MRVTAPRQRGSPTPVVKDGLADAGALKPACRDRA